MVLTYSHAFLVGALWTLFQQVYFQQSYFILLDDSTSVKFYARDIVVYIWICFVMQPLNMYLLGAIIKLFWWVEQRVGVHWIITFSFFLFFDMICAIRPWAIYNGTNGFVAYIKDGLTPIHYYEPGSGSDKYGDRFWPLYPSPFNFMPDIIVTYWHPTWLLSEFRFFNEIDNSDIPSFLGGGGDQILWVHNPFKVNLTRWSVVFLWLWVVLTTVFTYLIYEPSFSRFYRKKFWSWIKS